jgi:GNAT superfamily N-acetyltransferase
VKIDVHNSCADFNTYRAARVKSLFNAESGAHFDLEADLPIDGGDWKVGVVVGPSGSGKTSVGRALWGGGAFYRPDGWPDDAPIVDAIAPGGSFDDVTAALGAVGLGDVPAWLRPYRVLSNGEQFRADLARIIAEEPARVVVDEFTSVVDRQIARVGAGAFAKAWRRTPGQAVLLTCHYDVLDWLEPDWIFDTREGRFTRECHQHRRPRLDLEVRTGGWDLWPIFKPHHYLDSGPMPFAKTYVGFIDGEPVVHLGMGSKSRGKAYEARACRMVVMPEWQGAGVGMRFLNHVCGLYLAGRGHLDRPAPTLFHTSHPGLCAALRRDARWRQVSAVLHGADSARSNASLKRAGRAGAFGGHMRAVQGFRYVGTETERELARNTLRGTA